MATTASLSDVIRELRQNRSVEENTTEQIEQLTAVVSNFVSLLNTQNDRDRLAEEEARRERNRTTESRPLLEPPNSGTDIPQPNAGSATGDFLKAILSGSVLIGLGKKLMAFVFNPIVRSAAIVGFTAKLTSLIFKPIMAIGRMLTGPLGLVVAGLYVALKDIGDNPKFNKTIAGVKELWNNKLIPLFNKFNDMLKDVSDSPKLISAFDFIQKAWKGFSEWVSGTLKPVIQNITLDIINILTTLFSDVIDTINMAISGDWKGAFVKLFFDIGKFLTTSLDVLLTRVLELFKVDFGPDGTLFKSIGNSINGIIQWFKDGFSMLENFFMIEIPLWFSETKDFIYNKFWETIENVKNTITAKFNELDISGRITNAITSIQNKFDEIIDGFKGMVDYIAGIPGRITDYIISIIPSWMKSDTQNILPTVIPNSSFTQPLSQNTINYGAEARDVNEWLNSIQPNSAQRISQESAAIESKKNNLGVIISQDNRSSSNVNTSNTTMMGFSSPINEYAPQ